MKRAMILSAGVVICWLGLVSVSEAQVFIRAPFVRVGVGDGVYVRAPFVNLYIPPSGPVYGPRVMYVPAPIVVGSQPPNAQPMPPASEPVPVPLPPGQAPFTPPIPQPAPNDPPAPVQQGQVMTHDAFAKTFQAKAGSYELTILNPVTKQPNAVRFTLPEGTPRRVVTTRDSVEFIYSLRQWVRIEFDRDGVQVTTR